MDIFRRTGGAKATIANGATLSNAINLHGYTMLAFVFPAAWTSADLTFQVSHDGTTFPDLYDESGTQVKIASATMATLVGKGVSLDSILTLLAPWRYLRLKSGANQGAERVFEIVLKA